MTAFGEYQDDETASCMKSRDYKDATDLIAQEPKAYNVTMCDSNGTRKDRPDGGMYVNETDSANTLTTSEKDKLLIAQQEGIAFEPRSADGEPRITGDIKEVVSPTLNCMGGGQREPSVVSWNGDITPKASEDVSVTLRSQQGGEGVGVAFHASQDPIHSEEHTPAFGSNATIGVAFTASDRSNKAAWEGEISGTINCQMNSESSNLQMGVRENLTVRRLTPIECERLQGFPDNWTAEKMELTLEGNEWKATGKVVKQADGPRYRQQGNAVTVNVAEWIGKQIGKVLL
jgi:DNA (cytosine-5)-methyltransferase 1